MLLADIYHLPIYIALGVVVGVLGLSVLASIMFPPPAEAIPAPTELPEEEA